MPALADLIGGYSELEARSLVDLTRRRGGGGGGGGRGGGGGGFSGSSGGSRGGSSGSSSSSGGTSGARSSTPGFTAGSVSGGSSLRGSSSANGISTPYTITSGAFTGRTAGGGTRGGIYGSGGYGGGRGTAGAGLPFIYWPLGFGALGAGYYGASEYRNRTGRPGGDETVFLISPPAGVDAEQNRFFLVGDNNSIETVRDALASSCGTGSSNATAPSNFSATPEEVAQYYRGSSFALGLDGYDNGQPAPGTNDTTALAKPLAALPSSVNQTYFSCLNSTVGQDVPLVSELATDAAGIVSPSVAGLIFAPALVVAFLLNI